MFSLVGALLKLALAAIFLVTGLVVTIALVVLKLVLKPKVQVASQQSDPLAIEVESVVVSSHPLEKQK
jgi:hypothetical protein